MVYREHASRIDTQASDEPDQSLVSYDASGRRGANGADGASGTSGSYSGGDGGDGGHAGPAQSGQDGGVVHVELSAGSVGMARLHGRLRISYIDIRDPRCDPNSLCFCHEL